MRKPSSPRDSKARRPAGVGVAGNTSVRAFFAVWPDAAARRALARLADGLAAETGGRAPAAENLHLTLAFVGEVTNDRVDALRAAGRAATEAVSAFDLALDHVGAFRRSGIAWLGAASVPGELAQLVRQLTDALAAQDFPTDPRPFQAHVTLVRRCRHQPRAHQTSAIVWTIANLTLNASELASGAPRYRELAAWPLEPRGAGNR